MDDNYTTGGVARDWALGLIHNEHQCANWGETLDIYADLRRECERVPADVRRAHLMLRAPYLEDVVDHLLTHWEVISRANALCLFALCQKVRAAP